MFNPPSVEVGDVVDLSVFFPAGTFDIEMNFYSISNVEAVEDTGAVLNGLEFYKIGDGATIDIFIRFDYKFPCFEGGAPLDGFKFGNNFAGEIKCHGKKQFGRSYPKNP